MDRSTWILVVGVGGACFIAGLVVSLLIVLVVMC